MTTDQELKDVHEWCRRCMMAEPHMNLRMSSAERSHAGVIRITLVLTRRDQDMDLIGTESFERAVEVSYADILERSSSGNEH